MFKRNNSLLIFLLLTCILSRALTSIYYIEDIDSLRFALSIKDYDITKLQPHFPGYFVFCFLVKAIYLVIGNMGLSFSIVGGISIFFIIYYLLRIFSTSLKSYEGRYIALIIFFNPLFWLMSNRYMPDLMGLAISLGAIYYLIYAKTQRNHLEKGFFLSGVLAGVRLSYLPLIVFPLLKIFFLRNKKLNLTKSFFIGVLIWLIPMILLTGLGDLIIMAKKQTSGHFMDFGGTILTDQSIVDRLILLIKSVWADGFGGFWFSRGVTSMLLSVMLLIQFITSLKDVSNKWASENKIKPLIICVGIYFIWILLFQNVVYKSRHVLPIILFLCILLIEGQEKYRGKIFAGIVYAYFAVLLVHNANLINQHKNFTALQKLKNYVAQNEGFKTIISIPLINFYLQSHQIKADFINVENDQDIIKLSFDNSRDSSVLMVGDYRNLLSEEDSNFNKDTVFYHNPYMNQMWSKIITFQMIK
jgi:hypothetical protein